MVNKVILFLKQRPEIIIAIILLLIVFVVLKNTIHQKRVLELTVEKYDNAKIYSDSVKHTLDSVNIHYTDSLIELEYEIEKLQKKIENESRRNRINNADVKRLDDLVRISKDLIDKQHEKLMLLKKEPIEDKYNIAFLTDLIEALIENIVDKQKRINDLENQVSVLKVKLIESENENDKLLADKSNLESNYNVAKKELNKIRTEFNNNQAINNALLKVDYAVGNKRQLIKDGVLVKPFLKKQIYVGTINNEHLKTIYLKENRTEYLIFNSANNITEVHITPSLKGAEIIKKENVLLLKVNNVLEFIDMKQFVIYY